MTGSTISIVEVGPRDGFQPIDALIPTATKIELVRGLHAAGLRRIEATAFVSGKAVPQMADAAEVLAAAQTLPGLDVQVLVPSKRYCEQALSMGGRHVAFVLSVSESHNRSNVRRSPAESVEEYAALVALLPEGTKLRLNVATAFDCPFQGKIPFEATIALLDQLVPLREDVEIALCDTTGRATPDRVATLFEQAIARFGPLGGWVFHGHDTYGVGVANVLAAYNASVRIFDASFGGLGGCPFAPGATGNVATEDLVWAFENMGVATGVDLKLLIGVAAAAAALPGAASGGRVRAAVQGAERAAARIAA
jgi:hydroxymethylglutaryl-CoA lyase